MEGIAEYYSAELSQKIRRGQNESREKGNFVGGGITYGYKVINKKVVVDDDEAEAVRYIFSQYASGLSAREIIDLLHNRGLSHRGKPFLPNAIYKILRNTRYIGYYFHNGKKYTNAFPQIVATELFKTIQTILAKNKLGSHSRDTVFLLKGKLFCGICGKNMNGESGTSNNGKVNYYYKCSTKKKKSSACPKKTVRKDDIEKIVLQTTMDILNTPAIVERIADSVADIHRKRHQNQYVLNLLKEDRDKKQKSLKNLLAAIEEGIITSTTKQRMTELEDEINILNRKILEEENKDANLITREQIIEFLTVLPELEPQLIIDTMIRKVILYDDKIDIHFNFCDTPQNDEPDNFPTEDCRAYNVSFKSSLKSVVPPRRQNGTLTGAVFVRLGEIRGRRPGCAERNGCGAAVPTLSVATTPDAAVFAVWRNSPFYILLKILKYNSNTMPFSYFLHVLVLMISATPLVIDKHTSWCQTKFYNKQYLITYVVLYFVNKEAV